MRLGILLDDSTKAIHSAVRGFRIQCSRVLACALNRRLNDVLADNGVTRVDYLSIDTEGSEFDILKSIDFEQVTYKAISAENNYLDGRIEKH